MTAVAQLELLEQPVFRYRLTDTAIREETDIGTTELHWRGFDHCCAVEGFLVLVRKPADAGQIVALPADQLPAPARALILDKLALR